MNVGVIQTITTPDGPFTILSDEDGTVYASGWTADSSAILARLRPTLRPERVRSGRTPAADAAAAYYAGQMQPILEVAVRQEGTPWQRRGWEGLRAIPAGRALTYSEFAVQLERPSAVRAAASVCARNAAALFVPCHRVLRTDGTLGGFAWGAELKRSLLAREQG